MVLPLFHISRATQDTVVVYHLLEKTGWSTVEVNGTRQIPNGNFHGDALVSSPRLFRKLPYSRENFQESTGPGDEARHQ